MAADKASNWNLWLKQWIKRFREDHNQSIKDLSPPLTPRERAVTCETPYKIWTHKQMASQATSSLFWRGDHKLDSSCVSQWLHVSDWCTVLFKFSGKLEDRCLIDSDCNAVMNYTECQDSTCSCTLGYIPANTSVCRPRKFVFAYISIAYFICRSQRDITMVLLRFQPSPFIIVISLFSQDC